MLLLIITDIYNKPFSIMHIVIYILVHCRYWHTYMLYIIEKKNICIHIHVFVSVFTNTYFDCCTSVSVHLSIYFIHTYQILNNSFQLKNYNNCNKSRRYQIIIVIYTDYSSIRLLPFIAYIYIYIYISTVCVPYLVY